MRGCSTILLLLLTKLWPMAWKPMWYDFKFEHNIINNRLIIIIQHQILIHFFFFFFNRLVFLIFTDLKFLITILLNNFVLIM